MECCGAHRYLQSQCLPPLTGINSLLASYKYSGCSSMWTESKRMKLAKTTRLFRNSPHSSVGCLELPWYRSARLPCCPLPFHKVEELRRNKNKLLKSKKQVSNYFLAEKQKWIGPYTSQERVYCRSELRAFHFSFRV